jgi:hypothetical protein
VARPRRRRRRKISDVTIMGQGVNGTKINAPGRVSFHPQVLRHGVSGDAGGKRDLPIAPCRRFLDGQRVERLPR